MFCCHAKLTFRVLTHAQMYTISSTWRQIYNNFNRSVLAFLEWNFEGFVCVIVGI